MRRMTTRRRKCLHSLPGCLRSDRQAALRHRFQHSRRQCTASPIYIVRWRSCFSRFGRVVACLRALMPVTAAQLWLLAALVFLVMQ